MTGAVRDMSHRVRCLLMVVVCGSSLAGCSWFGFGSKAPDCKSIEEYQNSANLPPVTVPPDLNRPDEHGGLKIPAGPLPAEPLSDNAACLARPPDYFKKPTPAAATLATPATTGTPAKPVN